MNTVDKLLAVLPSTWFSDSAKKQGGLLYAVLSAFATGLDYVSDGIAYTKDQTRISTATGSNLDNISIDFFGSDVGRKAGETDDAYRSRIKRNLFRERATRAGVVQAVEDLGAQVVEVFEPCIDGFFPDFHTTDGRRISDTDPYQAILFIQRPLTAQNLNLLYTDGKYTDACYIPDENSNLYTISDDEIFEAVENNKVAGTRVWVVLDPIPMLETETPNFISTQRYWVRGFTGATPDIFTLDNSSLGGEDVLL